MSYTHGYDDDKGERYIEVEIDYTLSEGGWEYPHPCTPSVRFWIPHIIEVDSVRVMLVEYYSTSGDIIASIKREDIGPKAIASLDAEQLEYINTELEDDSVLYENMLESY